MIRLTSRSEDAAFLAEHVRQRPGSPIERCSCGWVGADWRAHMRAVLVPWLEERRLALRARLLTEEGVERP
jgi:hypothetical protein